MVRAMPVLLIVGVLAGCAGSPAAEDAREEQQAALQLSCYQTAWQAETIQVVYKRGGQEVWDRYDLTPQVGNVACR
ncbi:hypothetical protein NRB16_12630 [Pseudomonas sp. LJDD11]|uniref:hypothetical protein n=1 Tax=Pseudomonas sp. LJDD11 TaxID=2931984 RepID=UPI00211BC7D7|nr:hypothetical protein [Pseudomonas sp. LJDD11]MCQ9424360.1 hypothetical protein [Pseudomonas sp. LJDD11]